MSRHASASESPSRFSIFSKKRKNARDYVKSTCVADDCSVLRLRESLYAFGNVDGNVIVVFQIGMTWFVVVQIVDCRVQMKNFKKILSRKS